MIRSMTGYGRSVFAQSGIQFEVELRSVNHRFLDIRVKLPKLLAEHETRTRERIQRSLVRGKVDMSVQPVGGGQALQRPAIDREVAEQYLAAARSLAGDPAVDSDFSVGTLLGLPGVTRFEEPDLDRAALANELDVAVGTALAALVEMRELEGRALADELEGRLARVVGIVDSLESRAGLVKEAAIKRLRRRTEQIEAETGLRDEARLAQEILIAADRLDIIEELVRLRSHVEQFRKALGEPAGGEGVGRRLDFLLQEFGREANTVGSKANDAPLAHEVVELKTELERIREQVQNVE